MSSKATAKTSDKVSDSKKKDDKKDKGSVKVKTDDAKKILPKRILLKRILLKRIDIVVLKKEMLQIMQLLTLMEQ
jgi:hypothetical protein